MYRWDIINHFIKENNYSTYLEIGYYKGWSFEQIDIRKRPGKYLKVAVDPNPSANEYQENMKYGDEEDFTFKGDNWSIRNRIIKITSDDYFYKLPKNERFDIIFIDGQHEANQVLRDLINSCVHLSPNGTIVFHDMLPTSYEMITTGTQLGEWTGDVYRIGMILSKLCNSDKFYVVDTDYGVGVLKPGGELKLSGDLNQIEYLGRGPRAKTYDPWQAFSEQRNLHVNVVSIDKFKDSL